MKIVILGSGRVGARIATLLEQDGHQVTIIDSDPASFERLPETFAGQTVLGTGIDVDVLKSAGIETADAFAAVTNFDNTNIMACEVAKEIFGVKKVLARIYDPGRESLYHELGLETVCPTTLVSTTARDILSPRESVVTPQPVASSNAIAQQAGTNGAVTPVTARVAVGAVNSPATPAASTNGSIAPNSPLPAFEDEVSPVGQAVPTGEHGGETPANGRSLRGLFRH